MAVFVCFVNILLEVAKMYFLLTDRRIIQRFAEDFIMVPFSAACFVFAIAAFDYYVLWWIVPNFINSIILYSLFYFGFPLIAIQSALACFGLVKENPIFQMFKDVKKQATSSLILKKSD